MRLNNLQLKRAVSAVLFFVLLSAVGMTKALAQSFTMGDLNYFVNSDGVSVTVTGHVDGTAATGVHDYVDLGLPSGLLWATCNVGANAPEEYGDYFAWGETQPKDVYNWDTYQYCMGSYNTLTKYCTRSDYGFNGFTDNLTILLPEDDAATANWGNGWRMPTIEEWQELYQNTTHTWTTQNGVNGRLFTASNGSSLFLPAAGYRWDDELYDVGSLGYSWSSSLSTDYPLYAWYFYFRSDRYIMYSYSRSYGRSVRAVRSSQSLSYTINATPNPVAGGAVSGAGNYNYGETCTLTATANTGYNFVRWTKNGTQVSTNPTYSFTVTENANCVAYFRANSYTISASANPTEGGTVSGAGTYNHGSTCTLTATANTNYNFTNWTKDGTVVSTDAIYSFTVTENANCVAYFRADSYTISASANPTEGGTVSGAGTYNHGTTCTLTATANTNYNFTNWTKDGTVVSTDAIYSFTVTGSGTYVANFSQNAYTITASAIPSIGGSVSGAGNYNYGDNCTLTATANTGYTFVRWTKNGTQVSTNPSYSFTVTENANCVAYFRANSYTISASANPTEGGTVSGEGTYNHGTTCTLTATANEDYSFTNWTKDGTVVSTDAIYSFTVTGSGNYVANFSQNAFTISASAIPIIGGSVSGAGNYNYGETCTLTATANTGYNFVRWTKNGTQVSTNPSYSFTVTENASCVAYFRANSYTISVSVNPTEGGTVSGAGTYNHGTTCTLTATANEDYTFVNWTENGEVVSTDAEYSFTVTGNRNLDANFGQNTYTISASAIPSNGGSVSGAGNYYYGDNCTLTATPNTGFSFIRWTKNGTQVSTNATYSFTVTENANCVAYFRVSSYIISASANPTEGGMVSGGGTFNHGTTCTLTATANTNYNFTNWTKDGTVVSTDATYSFTVTSSGSYVANFSHNTYTISVSANPSNGGIVNGGGTYNHGANCTLTAIANTGYTFINLTKDGTVVSTSAIYSFTVTGSGTYVANFNQNNYTISVSANPTEGGTVNGGGTYHYGANCTLTATANTGYDFINWTKNGTQVSTIPTYSFTVTSSATYVANFSQNTFTISASANPSNGGSVSGAGNYNYGDNCTLTATPNTGFSFIRWTKNGTQVSTDPSYSFTVTENANCVAYFRVTSYTISASANPTEGGTVSGGGTFNHGTTCTLTATANEDYTFVNWTENGTEVSTNAIYSFTVTGSGTYVANFSQNTYYTISASADPSNGGSVSGAGNYNYGDNCTLTATANTGYNFVNWTENGTVVSTNAIYSFTVTGSGTYVANFSQNTYYTISASADPSNGGSVSGAGNYNYGDNCTLTATANTGYNFVNWTENSEVVSTNPTYSFTVTEDASYVANFELNSYTITATANPVEGGTITGAGIYNHGSTCTLTATANTGYTFINWTKHGRVVSTNPTYSFIVSRNASYVANFELNSYTITATANPMESGMVSGVGNYNHGATATLTATANTRYTFINWTRDGTVVSTNPTYSFTVTENVDLVANFEAEVGLPGDANGDGMVNALDIVIIVNHIFGETPEEFVFANADINEDGIVNALDLVAIVNLIFSTKTNKAVEGLL